MSAESKSEILYGPSRLPWHEQVPLRAKVKAPSEDPITVYPRVPPVTNGFPEIDYEMFEIPPTGLSEAEHAGALAAFRDFAETQHEYFTGYQTNQNQKYSSRLSWLMDMHTNNVGDPFSSGWFTLNTKFMERACLDYFAALWNIEWPHVELSQEEVDKKTATELEEIGRRYWGWVLSMGSTEANLYSLFNARDYLKGLELKEVKDPENGRVDYVMTAPVHKGEEPPAGYYKPIIFYSEDTHYSVTKCVRILELTDFKEQAELNGWDCPLPGTKAWPDQVPSHSDGTIRVEDLKLLVEPFIRALYPIIIVLNVGSTWKGAYDDVKAVNDMLEEFEEKYDKLWSRNPKWGKDVPAGHKRRGFWVHVDGALGASYLPFLEMARKEHGWKSDQLPPRFDFRNRSLMSICTSTHKWPGAPWAGSVYMTRTKYQLFPPSNPSYIGAADTTLGGSRNAATAALLWDYLARTSYEDSMQAAMKAEATAELFEQELEALERELKKRFPAEADKIDLWIKRTPLSLAVRFRLVKQSLVYKYTIDREEIDVKNPDTGKEERRTVCHVYFMQSLTRELALQLIEDIRTACKHDWRDAFPERDWSDGELNPHEPPKITIPEGAKLLACGQGLGSAGSRTGTVG